MSIDPILLVGGAGVVGRIVARYLRDAHPDLPLLIGGRDRQKAAQTATEIGHAEGVVIDISRDDLGLGDRDIAAVAVFFIDYHVSALSFSKARGVPYISMSSLGVHEIALEAASYMYAPVKTPVVLGTEWFVGATVIPILELCKQHDVLQEIRVNVLLDDDDAGGPQQSVDLENVTKVAPPALGRRDGAFYWRVGADAKAQFRTFDGRVMSASALSPYDVLALANITSAAAIQFNIATGVSSSRRRGDPLSTEIIVELSGTDIEGRSKTTRHAIVHPHGQMPPTALGVAMCLERLASLDGQKPLPAGLYFPSQVLRPEACLERLGLLGSKIMALEP